MFPRAWLVPGETASFTNVPTVFGPVDLEVERSGDGSRVDTTFAERFHHAPKRVVLHLPPADGVERWTWNGQILKAASGRTIDVTDR